MEKKIKNYRLIKLVELIVFFLLEVFFLVVLLVNKTLRSSIFVDRSLFILCTIMYISVLATLLMLVFDFIKIRDLKTADHALERTAFLDKKTGLPNRTGVNVMSESYSTPDSLKGVGCVVSEISNIKAINEALGKDTGDRIIRDFTKLLEKSAEKYGFVGRNGGNEYIAILDKCDANKMAGFLNELSAAVSEYNESYPSTALDIRSEHVLFDSEEVSSFSELVAKAYRKLGR